jgi:hypothetical protein
MPMFNWSKVFHHNMPEFLCRNTLDFHRFSDKEIIESIDCLLDNYNETFGFNKRFKNVLRLRIRAHKLRQKYIQTGQRHLINDIDQLELEIENYNKRFKNEEKTDFDKQLIRIENWRGFKINLKQTSVREFFAIIEEYKSHIKLSHERTDKKR